MSNDDIDDPVTVLMDAILDQCRQHKASPRTTHTALLVITGESAAAWATTDEEFEKWIVEAKTYLEEVARNSWAANAAFRALADA